MVLLIWKDYGLQGATTPPNETTIPEDLKMDIRSLFYVQKVEKIDSLMQARPWFNGALLVAVKGVPIFSKTYGYADFRRHREITENTPFQLASVSKQFTAMAIMMLKEQGKLSYEDTVQRFIPDFPYKGVTIRMLLNHSAGMPNYFWLTEHKWQKESIPTNKQVMALLAREKPSLYFRPGSRFDYSNTNYVVLASIVENASQMEFGKFVEENIFQPLGMNNSFVYSAALDESPKGAKGYRRYGRGYREIPATVNDGAVGDKGVYASLVDLYKWDQALYANILVKQETLKEAFSPLILHKKYRMRYGFGFRLQEDEMGHIVYHNGKWNGFRTGIHRYIDEKATVIILNNTNKPGNTRIINEIENILFRNQPPELAALEESIGNFS
jgi:CubicO group peptidase (beta-lactamase class C family)